jgi:DNA-binding transcriptional ArsR family regulator
MNEKALIIPFGDGIDTTYQLIRSFPTKKIFLICSNDDHTKTLEFQNSLEKFKIPIKISRIKDYSLQDIFKTIRKMSESEKDSNNIIINISSGSKVTSCLTLCAAYVYGITAVAVMEDRIMMMPVVRLSYYKVISSSKLKILRLLYDKKNCCAALEVIKNELDMSLPLVSYHINGTAKKDGLKQMGLVDTVEGRKRIEVTLSTLGEMLMMGYV